MSELTDVQPPPSKALNLGAGVSLIEDGRQTLQGPEQERKDRMTLSEYHDLLATQKNDMRLRFRNLEFFKRQASREKRATGTYGIAGGGVADLRVTTKTRFK